MTMEARAAYQQVLAREPDNREALTNMIALIGDADPAGALSELERLQTVAPDFSPIPAQMGMLLARQGRIGEALGALRRAVALSPENALYHYNMAVVSDRTADAARSYERVLRLLDGGSAPGGLRAQPIRDRLRYLRARL
jgi:Flp pilus assembly protein TadD